MTFLNTTRKCAFQSYVKVLTIAQNGCFDFIVLRIGYCGIVWVLPCKRKYWWVLKLANWLQTRHSKVLAEFKFGCGPKLAGQGCQVLIIV